MDRNVKIALAIGGAAALGVGGWWAYNKYKKSPAILPPGTSAGALPGGPSKAPIFPNAMIDRYLLADVYGFAAIRGIQATIKPGELMPTSLMTQANVGPVRFLQIQKEAVYESQQDAAFQQKMGYKRRWKASELLEAQKQGALIAKQQIRAGGSLPTTPLPSQILYAMPMIDLGIEEAKKLDPAVALRLQIEIDTPESLHWFSDLMLFGLLTSFDPKAANSRQFPNDAKGKAQLAICQRIFNMFGYHDWIVSENIVNQQISTLEQMACSFIPELTDVVQGGSVVPDPDMKSYVDANWGRKCLPPQWPTMGDPSRQGNNIYACPVSPQDYQPGTYLTVDQEAKAREVLKDGTMFLYEYSLLRLNNISMVASFLENKNDAEAQMTDSAKKLSMPGTPGDTAVYVVGKLIGVIAKLSAGDIAGAIAGLVELLVRSLIAMVMLFVEMAKADEDNDKLQRGLALHLDRVLSQWIQRPGNGTDWLSGYRLGCILDDHVPDVLANGWYDELKRGVSRSVTAYQRNFYLVGGGLFGVGCANVMMPQIPLFMRGIPFGVLTNPSVYPFKKVIQGIWPQYYNGKPVGWRRFELNTKTQMIEFPGTSLFPPVSLRQFALGYPQAGTQKIFGG